MKRFLVSSIFFLSFSALNAMDSEPRREIGERRECQFCLDEKDSSDCIKLHCGHEFCKDCLTRAIDLTIRDKDSAFLKCPSCEERFAVEDVRSIAEDQKEKVDAVHGVLALNWLAAQIGVRHCLTPDCPYQYLYESEREDCFHKITCPGCERDYCANCGVNHDEHITCGQVTQLRELSDDDKLWLRQNTRLCPTCGFAIQKTEGCDHVFCIHCSNHFCFNCLAPGFVHNFCPLPKAPVQERLEAIFLGRGVVPRVGRHGEHEARVPHIVAYQEARPVVAEARVLERRVRLENEMRNLEVQLRLARERLSKTPAARIARLRGQSGTEVHRLCAQIEGFERDIAARQTELQHLPR